MLRRSRPKNLRLLTTLDWQKGVLAWFADHFVPDDPASLIMPDGPGDGGIDIVSIVTSESRNHVRVFQCSAPTPENIAEGRLSTKKTKFADDVREFRNNIIGKARKLKSLNSTAQEVIRQINGMREFASVEESPTPLTIEVAFDAVMYQMPAENLTSCPQQPVTNGPQLRRWIVRDVLDARDLLAERHKSRTTATELKPSL